VNRGDANRLVNKGTTKATQVAKLREMIEMLDQGIVREVINYLFKEVLNQGVVFPRECAQTLYKFFLWFYIF